MTTRPALPQNPTNSEVAPSGQGLLPPPGLMRHLKHLAARAAYALRQPHLKDDLLQEAMLAYVKAALRYDPTRGASVATYAGRRAVGAIADAVKVERRVQGQRARVPDDLFAGLPASCRPVDVSVTERVAVEDALRAVPSREREVIMRRFFFQEPLRIIAVAWGRTTSTIQALEQQALRRLRKILGSA